MAYRAIKNLLVTGGCGFIGSNLIHYLLNRSDFSGRIINLDKITYAGNPENLNGLEDTCPERYIFHRGDICNLEDMKHVFSLYKIDSVCHLAAESHVDRSIRKPAEFIFTNFVGTFNLLELSRAAGEDFIIFHHVSTDEVYGSLGPRGLFTESTPYRPNSPYSASKAGSDHLVRAYYQTYGLKTTISNCSNNYGPFQFPEKLIPLMILNSLELRSLPVYGDGKNIRDWLYVEDHCSAIWEIMKSGASGETYNVGGNSEIENLKVVETICDIIDELRPVQGVSRRGLIRFVEDRPGHDRRYAIDSTKLQSQLHWRPHQSFESGLRKTIAWYLDNPGWVNRVRSGAYQSWIDEHYGKGPKAVSGLKAPH